MTHAEFVELWENDELESVWRELDDSWRHGNNVTEVFKDKEGRFWQVSYRVSGDGEYHGIRDNEMHALNEVEPFQVQTLVTHYRLVVE